MVLYFPYALVLGAVLSIVVLIGCATGRRTLILFGMVFAALVASPITSFTRGAAGAIYASDLVSFILLVCWFLPKTRALMFSETPIWYRRLFWLMMLALVSTVFIAPFFSGDLAGTGYASHVRSPIPGVPLVVLMAGFRVIKILLYLPYFAFSCHLLVDEKSLRFVYKTVLCAIVILSICQIIDSMGIKDLSFYLPRKLTTDFLLSRVNQILGHVKLAAGRLYLLGVFVCLILLYRSWSSFIYLLAMGTIIMAILLSGNRAAFVGMLAGFAVLGFCGKGFAKILVILFIALLPIGFMVLSIINPEITYTFTRIIQNPSSNPRWVIWSWTVVNLFTHPYIFVSGVGFSNFAYAIAGQDFYNEHGHNDVLTCITELGLIGAILFVSFLFHLGRDVFRRIKYSVDRVRWEAVCMSAAFMGFLVTSMFEITLYYSPHTLCMQRIFAVLFGTYTAWWVQQDSEAGWEHELADDGFSEEEYYLLQDSEC